VNDAHLRASILTLGDPQRVTGGNLYNLRLADAAPAHGVALTFVSYPLRRFPLPATATRGVRRSALPADVVVVDSIVAAYAAPWAIPLARHRPVVALVHQPPGGMEGGWAHRTLQGVLDAAFYRRAAAVIAASDSLAEDLVAAGVREDRVTVVPPGADDLPVLSDLATDAGETDAPDLRGGRGAALLAAGAWVPRKGILELLDAFAQLPASAATLHLVGDSAADRRYAARIQRRLTRPELAGRVVVHGVVPPSELRVLYRAADVFVLASTVEPYGTVYGEALAAGLPLVGWRAGNLPHLITEGREGLMVEVGDIDGLARALLEVSTDEQRRADLATAAAACGAGLPRWDSSFASFFAVLRASARLTRSS
jgi:glycosyltransferase involved in cell wall biosynthesis